MSKECEQLFLVWLHCRKRELHCTTGRQMEEKKNKDEDKLVFPPDSNSIWLCGFQSTRRWCWCSLQVPLLSSYFWALSYPVTWVMFLWQLIAIKQQTFGVSKWKRFLILVAVHHTVLFFVLTYSYLVLPVLPTTCERSTRLLWNVTRLRALK